MYNMTALQKWEQNTSITPWCPAAVSVTNLAPSMSADGTRYMHARCFLSFMVVLITFVYSSVNCSDKFGFNYLLDAKKGWCKGMINSQPLPVIRSDSCMSGTSIPRIHLQSLLRRLWLHDATSTIWLCSGFIFVHWKEVEVCRQVILCFPQGGFHSFQAQLTTTEGIKWWQRLIHTYVHSLQMISDKLAVQRSSFHVCTRTLLSCVTFLQQSAF